MQPSDEMVEKVAGEIIEPPMTVEQRLAAHCEYAEKDWTSGDYFHLLARDALAEIRRLRAALSAALTAETEPDEAEFELWQNGDFAAGSSGPRADALREIAHYAAVYGRDGPCEVQEVKRIPIDLTAAIRNLKDTP